MSSSSTKTDEATQGASQISKQQQKKRAAIPQIEVVNEIQIVVSKKESQRSATTPSDSKDIKKCISSRSSKTDLTAVTTPTTATLDTTTKHVTIKNGRKASRDKEKSESNSTICMCGKLLKRVKGLLEKKEKGGEGECRKWNSRLKTA
jgi:hypothetical protein